MLPVQALASGNWSSAHPEFPIIFYKGPIDKAMAADFHGMLRLYPNTTTVSLDSGGGNVYAALEVAQEIDRRGLNTLIMEGNECYSACSFIFLAGKSRSVKGKIGVHQISGTDDTSITQHAVADIYDNLIKFGVDRSILSAMFKTSSDDMYIFSKDEVYNYGINRDKKTASDIDSDIPEGTSLETIAVTRNGIWEAALLRNEKNGHYLCSLEAISGGTTFRIVNYMTKNDAFVEILDTPFPMRQGAQLLHFAFRKKEQNPWVLAVPSFSENDTTIWFNIEKEEQGLMITAAVGLANSMLIQSDGGKLLGFYDLTGSLRSSQAFSRCIKSS